MKRQKYIIAYDIVNNRRRRKIAQLLEAHGTRMNRSVFECILDNNSFTDLLKRLERLVKKSEDSVLLYQQCRVCGPKAFRIGTAPRPEANPPLEVC